MNGIHENEGLGKKMKRESCIFIMHEEWAVKRVLARQRLVHCVIPQVSLFISQHLILALLYLEKAAKK